MAIVVYDGNGATSGTPFVDYNPGNDSLNDPVWSNFYVLANPGNFARTGYILKGWSFDPNASTPNFVVSGNTVTPPWFGGNANYQFYGIYEYDAFVLFAVWEAIPGFAVTYNGNGSTGGSVPVDGNSYVLGTTVTVAANPGGLTKTGHIFLGWANTSSATTPTFAVTGSIVNPPTFNMPGSSVTLYAVWRPTYTVVYNGNGHTSGSAPVDSNSPYPNGSTVTVLGQGSLLKTGYTFLGWATSNSAPSATHTANSTFIIAANTTLYAVWQLNSAPKYKVTYNGNNNTGGSVPVDSGQYQNGAAVLVKANTGNLVRTNYTFLGWATSSTATVPTFAVSGSVVSPSTFTMGSANVTLYAVWTILRTLTYNGNGNTDGSAPVDSNSPYSNGASATVLSQGSLVKANYVFQGWATTSTATTPNYTAGSTIVMNANVVLYAVWQVDSNLSLVMDQINTSPSSFLPTSTGECGHGQAFTGNGGIIKEARFSLRAENVVNWNGGTMWVEIYAHSGTWGSNGLPTGSPLAVSEILNLQEMGEFNGWISFAFSGNNQFQTVAGQHYFVVLNHANGGYYAGPDVGITNNSTASNGGTTAYLRYNSGWQQIGDRILFQVLGTPPASNFIVTYDGNGSTGGSVPVDNNAYVYGAAVTVAANPSGLVRAGYNFLGWSQLPNASVPTFGVTGSTVTPPNFNIIASNVTLYAVWQLIQYFTVTYHGNGNTSGSAPVDSNSPYLMDSTVTVLGQGSLGWHLYLFAGWSSDPLGQVECSPGTTFTITGNVDLYAIWYSTGPPVGNQYTVTYNGNGASGFAPVDYNVYQSGGTVTVLGQGSLVKAGSTFLGWSTNPRATSAQYVPGSTFGIPPNNITLYAVWGSGGGGNTVGVPYDGRYAGSASKQNTLNYNGASTILKVASNVTNNGKNSCAVIENLIINGNNAANSIGILLDDVYNCLIRNVTIMNCDVGIKVQSTNANFSLANRFEHIRMINVKTGIQFVGGGGGGGGGGKDFFFTSLDDVGISLKNDSAAVGIQVDAGAKLFSAFIKATVWLPLTGGTGLVVRGDLKYSLVNLAVDQVNNNNTTGKGVDSTSGVISNNQSFILTAVNVTSNNKVIPNNATDITTIP